MRAIQLTAATSDGYRERRRVVYRGTPLIYYGRVLENTGGRELA